MDTNLHGVAAPQLSIEPRRREGMREGMREEEIDSNGFLRGRSSRFFAIFAV
jgi:hypothetical protein